MAAPITHIVFSEQLFPKYFSPDQKRAFMIGTSFPDIRYKGVISRENSHPKVGSFNDVISEANSFYAGQKFHAYFDLIRENYLIEHDLYDLIPKGSRFITQSVKFLEDKIFYPKINEWNNIANFFQHVRSEELQFGISERDIKAWHQTLQEYFRVPPSEGSLSKFLCGISIPTEAETQIDGLVAELEKNDAVIHLLEGMYTHLDIVGKLIEGDITEY